MGSFVLKEMDKKSRNESSSLYRDLIYVPISDTSGDSCVNACTLLVEDDGGAVNFTLIASSRSGRFKVQMSV